MSSQVTQRSQSGVLSLSLFTQCFLILVSLSVWPALTLTNRTSPKATSLSVGANSKSTRILPATVSKALKPSFTTHSSNSITFPRTVPSSISTLTALNLQSSYSKMFSLLYDEASHRDKLIEPNTTSTKISYIKKKTSLAPHSGSCRIRTLVQPIKRVFQLAPHTGKHLSQSHKTGDVPSHDNVKSLPSNLSLYPLPSEKLPPPSVKALSNLTSASRLPVFNSVLTPRLSLKISPRLAGASPSRLPESTRSPKGAASRQPHILPHTAGPLFEHQPFIVTWNIPSLVCNRHNISLDTSPFKGVATPAKVPGQFLSLFYTNRLGLYPHVDIESRKLFYGGIPQRVNMKASMDKAKEDINYYIPSKTTRGLAVIDWEEWRPLWDRNWGNKKIYQTLSVGHAMRTNHTLTAQQAMEKAKHQFEEAAKRFMSGMLELGKAMRPNYLWGFYLFPNCYNYGWQEPDYTGQCSREVRRQNDELIWLWESSTALYPSVYMQTSLADSPKAALMVRNRVQEALRASALSVASGIKPVFVYMRPVFVDQNRRFLSREDLISTIGESAAVGASGAVLWGASADFDDQASCEALSFYLNSTLNPYITNVTAAAQLCSSFLCRGNGRCVRKKSRSNHYLHLNSETFRIVHVGGRYLVLGRPTLADLKILRRRFSCQCYKGLSCTPRTYRELTKALTFSVKQGPFSLSKGMLANIEQASINEKRKTGMFSF